MRLRSYSKGMIQRVGVAQALVGRTRRRLLRRADVRTRSARPSRSSPVDAAAARPRLHCLFQLAHPGRCRSAVQPRRHRRAWSSGCGGPARRHRRVRTAAGGNWWWPTCRQSAEPHCRRAAFDDRRSRTIVTRWNCRRPKLPKRLVQDLSGHGVQVVSLEPDPDDARGLLRDDGAGRATPRDTSGIAG